MKRGTLEVPVSPEASRRTGTRACSPLSGRDMVKCESSKGSWAVDLPPLSSEHASQTLSSSLSLPRPTFYPQRQLRMTAVQQQAAFGSALYPSDSGTQESGFPPGMVAREEDAATGKGNEIPVKEEKGHEHLAGTARKPAPPAPSRRSPPPPHPGVHIRREGGSAEEEVAETPACLLGMSSPLAAGPLVRESEVWKEELGE